MAKNLRTLTEPWVAPVSSVCLTVEGWCHMCRPQSSFEPRMPQASRRDFQVLDMAGCELPCYHPAASGKSQQ